MQAQRNFIDTLQGQIKTRMEDKNLNAREVERRAGLKISAVQNILAGKSSNPGIEPIIAIAKLLNCSIDELVGNSVSQNYASNKSEVAKTKTLTVWNFDLYQSCLQEVQNYIKSKNLKPQPEQILFFIREAYIYSIEGKENKADLRFIKWIVDSHC